MRTDVISEETEARLINWGRYIRGGLWAPNHTNPQPDAADTEDGALVEWVITTWALCSIKAELKAFVLKLHYAEGWGTPDDRAVDVRRRFGVDCRERQFYNLLRDARRDVAVLLPPVGYTLHRLKIA